jgi:hypothetical protein
MVKIASFDIGEKNFAFSIGTLVDGCLTITKTYHHDVMKKKTQTIVESCEKITNILNDCTELVDCDHFVIEQQMRSNVRAKCISQHVWTYVHLVFKNQTLKYIPSHVKTQRFLGKNELGNKQRKNWSVSKVLSENNFEKDVSVKVVIDKTVLEHVKSLKKRDDVCDTILQMICHADQVSSKFKDFS